MNRYSRDDNCIQRRNVRIWMLVLAILLVLIMAGCGDTEESEAKADSSKAAAASSQPKGGYKAPDFMDSKFHKDEASSGNGVYIDTSAASSGTKRSASSR